MLKAILLLLWGGVLGAFAQWLHLPLPWMIGPLVGTAVLALMGLPVVIHNSVRKLGQLAAAVAIGTTFTAPVLAGLQHYLPAVLICGFISIGAGVVVAMIQSRVAGTTFRTSYFACLPGGVAEMSVLAERNGGETSLVALAQSLRVIIIVLTIPFALSLSHRMASPSPIGGAGWGAVYWPGLVAMFLAAGLLGSLLDRLSVMNAFFLGGLAVGIASILGPVDLSPIPAAFVNAAQVMIGVSLAGRLDPGSLRQIGRFLPASVAATFLLIMFNAAVAWLAAPIIGIDLETLVLATAPGGVAEMSLTAKALQLAVPLVTAFHLVRITLIITLSAPIFVAAIRVLPGLASR